MNRRAGDLHWIDAIGAAALARIGNDLEVISIAGQHECQRGMLHCHHQRKQMPQRWIQSTRVCARVSTILVLTEIPARNTRGEHQQRMTVMALPEWVQDAFLRITSCG